MKEKIIALYIRLSVEDRDLDELKTASVSIQNQKVHLRNFLMCHPETASGEIREFIDDGYTGTNMDRPAFQEIRYRKTIFKEIKKCIYPEKKLKGICLVGF